MELIIWILPDGLYSISDIQDYVEYILKRYDAKTMKPSTRIYINKAENRITFKIKNSILSWTFN